MINPVHTPVWLRRLFPQMVWDVPVTGKNIYLTFDDGPTPEVTPQVLAILSEYRAQATFFCLGTKIETHPALFESIKAAGHTIGNHGYQHISGFSTSLHAYLDNARRGEQCSGSKLFRPPYGRLTPRQISWLKKDYRLIQWSIMSMDFDAALTPARCLHNVLKNIKPGAIIVFHDSEKAQKNVLQVLPELLQWMEKNGYKSYALK